MWQLFYGYDTMLGLARHPNAEPWSNNMWNQKETWRKEGVGSVVGHMIDDGSTGGPLSGLPSVLGCVAVINSNHWKTQAGVISLNISVDMSLGSLTISPQFPSPLHICLDCMIDFYSS